MSSSAKCFRKSLSLKEKLQIIEDVEEKGLSYATIAANLHVNESTIRTIIRQKCDIKKIGPVASKISGKVHRLRDPVFLDMENALNSMIECNTERGFPVDFNYITEKALEFYSVYNKKHGVAEGNIKPFNASKGWFQKFCKRYGIHNVRLHGEMASADIEAAATFPAFVEQEIKAGGYCLDQVFNCDETKLFYKKTPQNSYVSDYTKKMPGAKADKKGFSILFCSNAAGSLMTKPLVINNVAKPRAIKDVIHSNLPVHYRSNKKGWMTQDIFNDWVENCFAPELESFCRSRNIGFKALLLLDNAPSHPTTFDHPNVKLLYLPPNTTSLIQPLDQGIIRNFKLLYIKKSYRHILQTSERDKPPTEDEAVLNEIVQMGADFGAAGITGDDIKDMIRDQPATVDEIVAILEPEPASEIDVVVPPPDAEEIDNRIRQLSELESFCALDSNMERSQKMQDIMQEFHPQLKRLLTEWKEEKTK
ncbi:tigger transposable element-derived protein 1-like [Aedes albopictus]|uniref:HTH CENPB-type domain-containing protein n=1 Tax=Aedes albopictus TaxID=7160 RepID=A0ABM1Z7A8_AEDAL